MCRTTSAARRVAVTAEMRPAWRRLAADARGTAAIEFAVLAPLLMAVLFGTVAFGLDYAVRIALTYAAAEGGRAAVAGLDDGERKSLAVAAVTDSLSALSPLIDPAKARISVTFSGSAPEEVGVSIAYDDTRFAHLPFLPALDGMAPVAVRYVVTDPSG